MLVELHEDHLRVDGVCVPLAGVRAVEESYNPWTGVAAVMLHGPGASFSMADGYVTLRPKLRARLKGVPWVSAWSFDGRFPGPVLGLPPAVALTLAAIFGIATVWGIAVQAGSGPALGLAVGLLLWVALVRRVVVVRPGGLRVGPVWAGLIPWHEVRAMALLGDTLHVATRHGLHRAAVCEPLLPALRGRVHRLGGWDLDAAPGDASLLRDTARLVPLASLTWALLGAAATAALVGLGWWWIAMLLVAALLVGLAAEAVHAQREGWAGGAVVLLLLATTAATYAGGLLRWWPV